MEVNIKSKTFVETKNERKEREFESCRMTHSFDERNFEIAVSNFTSYIPYSELIGWWPDNMQPDRKINLDLSMAVVLYENGKLELENL